MENELKIYFDESMALEPTNISILNGTIGLYFIYNPFINISYPFEASNLIYIGMSEKKTNSIGKRLLGHHTGTSNNLGITNYQKCHSLKFTYLNFEILESIWNNTIEQLENYFINDFIEKYGVYPICNNKSSKKLGKKDFNVSLDIDWNYFKPLI